MCEMTNIGPVYCGIDHKQQKIDDLERQLKEANEQGKQMAETANRAIYNLEQRVRELKDSQYDCPDCRWRNSDRRSGRDN